MVSICWHVNTNMIFRFAEQQQQKNVLFRGGVQAHTRYSLLARWILISSYCFPLLLMIFMIETGFVFFSLNSWLVHMTRAHNHEYAVGIWITCSFHSSNQYYEKRKHVCAYVPFVWRSQPRVGSKGGGSGGKHVISRPYSNNLSWLRCWWWISGIERMTACLWIAYVRNVTYGFCHTRSAIHSFCIQIWLLDSLDH